MQSPARPRRCPGAAPSEGKRLNPACSRRFSAMRPASAAAPVQNVCFLMQMDGGPCRRPHRTQPSKSIVRRIWGAERTRRRLGARGAYPARAGRCRWKSARWPLDASAKRYRARHACCSGAGRLGREGWAGWRCGGPARRLERTRADLHTRAGRRRHKGVGTQAYISSRVATRGCVWGRCCLSHTRRIDAKVSRILLGKAIPPTCSHERHGIATMSNGVDMGAYCFSVYSSVTPCSRLLPLKKVSCRSVHSDFRQTLCRAL